MKFELVVCKSFALVFFSVSFVLCSLFFIAAYGTNGPPNILGHSGGEIHVDNGSLLTLNEWVVGTQSRVKNLGGVGFGCTTNFTDSAGSSNLFVSCPSDRRIMGGSCYSTAGSFDEPVVARWVITQNGINCSANDFYSNPNYRVELTCCKG